MGIPVTYWPLGGQADRQLTERYVGEEEREGAARSQNVVLHGPADARTMAAAMRSGVERSRGVEATGSPACLIITPTTEQALTAADQARVLLNDPSSRVVPVSLVARARRVLGTGPVSVVAGTASDILALRRDSALRVDQLKAIVFVALDELLAEGQVASLEGLLGDIPDDASRVATLDNETPAVEAFLEAQLRRARRIAPPPAGEPLAVTPSYVLTSPAGRADMLRQVLDAIDPPSLVVVASNDYSAQDAHRALQRVGVIVDGLLVQVVRQPTSQHVALVILWDAPANAEALSEALATKPVDAVAFLAPEELPAFRRLTHGLAVSWVAPERKAAASSRVQKLRVALQSALRHGGGASASELALLAPLMDDYDTVEIAAAALRLYEGALQETVVLKAAVVQAMSRPASPAGASRGLSVVQGGKQRVFLAVGKRDNVRVGDIVGAVANEAGISGDKIGTVDMFESHTTVELSSEDAAKAVVALSSATLRGRNLSPRIDERGAPMGGAGRGGPSRGPSRGPDRGDRGDRGGDRGGPRSRGASDDRGPRAGGGDRPFRKPGGDRGDSRGPRSDSRSDSRGGGFRSGGSRDGGARGNFDTGEARRAYGDRSPAERTEGSSEWAQRGDRMKHAKRPTRAPSERPEPIERNDEE